MSLVYGADKRRRTSSLVRSMATPPKPYDHRSIQRKSKARTKYPPSFERDISYAWDWIYRDRRTLLHATPYVIIRNQDTTYHFSAWSGNLLGRRNTILLQTAGCSSTISFHLFDTPRTAATSSTWSNSPKIILAISFGTQISGTHTTIPTEEFFFHPTKPIST